jgi:transcriptional antiterminator RfaH
VSIERGQRAWHVVHTKPAQERLALTNLERQGYCCYLPLVTVERIKRNRVGRVCEPLFPRYLFVELSDGVGGENWAPIRSTLGVHQLVRFGGRAATIPNEAIGAMRAREVDTIIPVYEPGETVIVAAGAFTGLSGVYLSRDGEQRSMVLLEILSKPVKLAVDTAQLLRAA